MLVSLNVQKPELERVEPFVDQVFGGLGFGVESLERPEEEPGEDDYSSKLDEAPEPINHFTLRVIDGLTGEVCPNQEVWIASSRAVSEVRGALNEKQVLERGRRFETDSSGFVQIPFRYFAQKVAARKGGSFSFSSIYPDHGDEEALRITPQSNLVVRVVDQDGKPLRNVPVAIMEEREWSSHLTDQKVTRTRRGEVTWDNVFSQLANRENNKQYSVTFAFPTRNAKGIPIRPGDDFSEPIVLTLPETGSVVLRIDPEDVKGDEFVEYYPSSPDRAMYLPKIEVLGAATGLSYGHIDTRADGEFRKEPYTWVFPFVEVGLELSVVPAYGREPLLISGPKSAGDRVVVPLKVDQIGKKVISYGGWAGTEGDSHWVVHWEGHTSSTIEVTGRCLDADGQPMANTVMDWTVRRGRADKRESHSNTQVTTEADGSFKTRIFFDPGDDYNLRIQLIAVEDINASQVWSASWKGSDPPDPLPLGDLRPHPDARPFIPHFSIFVQDEAGEPIEGANCTLTSEIGNDPLRPLEQGEIHRATSFRTSSMGGATNAFGKVAIQGRGIHEAERGISLDECTDYLTVRASGYGDRTRKKIEHGARRVTITLKSFSNSGELSGSILLPDGFMVSELVGHELPAIWIESVDNPGQSIGQVIYRFSEDAMDFAVDDLPTGKYHLYTRVARAMVGWDENSFAPAPPVYEFLYAGDDDPAAIEFEIVEGARPSLEPIDLRETLHVIVLSVTNKQGHTPKDGYLVNVLGRSWVLDSGDLKRPELGTRVVSFGPAVDITITSRGFRQQRLDQVTGNRDVVLQPHLKIRLELAREVKFPDDSYSFRVCLKPLPVSGAKLRLNRTRRQLLGSGGLQVIVGGPGTWEVEWELTRIVGGQIRTFRIRDKLAAGPILIEESSAGATTLLTPPSTEMIERALDELK